MHIKAPNGLLKLPFRRQSAASQGQAIYRKKIRPLVYPQEIGKIVAIDVHTGAYEVDTDEMAARMSLEARCDRPTVWVKRIGYKTVYGFGRSQPDDD